MDFAAVIRSCWQVRNLDPYSHGVGEGHVTLSTFAASLADKSGHQVRRSQGPITIFSYNL